MTSAFALPPSCFACGGTWQGENERATCLRCGLLRTDAQALWHGALTEYEVARQAAVRGHFRDAQSHLAPTQEVLAQFAPAQSLHKILADGLGQTASKPAQAAYEQARQWAQAGQWQQARQSVEQTLVHAPAALDAHKLHLLLLAGAGESEQAEQIRHHLHALFPGDSDLSRWNFQAVREEPAPMEAEEALPVNVPEPSPTVDEAASATQPNRQNASHVLPWWRTSPVVWSGALFAGIVLVVAVSQQTRQLPTANPSVTLTPAPVVSQGITPSPLASAPPPATPTPSTVPDLPPDLQKRFEREQAERQATASEQQARRWMNEAVQAFRAKNWKQAEALSQGAYAVGGATSYLAQDALLLQARAADNQNNPVAHQLFARLAETYRQSEYAPVALLLAAQSANRHGNKAKANEYANRLRQRYAASPEARRLGSGQ